MQRTEQVSVDSVSSDTLPYGEFCETTNRIVIVSPYPSALTELIQELTLGCYDVLVFRHLNSLSLSKLSPDLVIFDLTKDHGAALDAIAVPQGAPSLFLVDGNGAGANREQTMQWPSRRAQFLPRIQSMLRAQAGQRTPEKEAGEWSFKDLRLDLKRLTCFIGLNRVDLTKTEFDLLLAIIEAEGAVLSRQSLMDRIWGENYFGGSNTIDVHMKSLRHKLNDNPKQPKYIATVRGIGYRLADA
ncbi:winged-helix domain-containing protein [Paenibacillus allorhizosphaerae]|uniref:OmpR/PhoB-type domain-containing protein n=1 Tax=Paenibacillus allorhizosphaerae TaxID=2849866 RepID=A0ABM8VCR8_9BACL|nr:response regulator transcription factor [Paenibacillus allorhizosphaerae]CAG7624818.1 hypothetical protein PAECIP111802_01103 [Paenibacillus allorhizosphaerae]